jgi:lysophospholipase L1-like esterase
MKNRFPVATALTMVTFAVLILIPQIVPALKNYRSLDPKRIPEVTEFPLKNLPDDVAADPLASPSSMDEMRIKRLVVTAPRNLIDPGHSLDSLYESLLKGETTTILHYGDSPTTADLITADARGMLQQEFGNAGVGFVLIARPWAWYNRRGVEMQASNWKIDVSGVSELRDGLNGLGAVSFLGRPGAVANWTLKDKTHTSVEIAYLGSPEGGEFVLEAEDQLIGTGHTISETRTAGYARFDIPEGASHFRLRVTQGAVRLYGADFRKSNAGVVYNSLGINGANVTLLSHALNQDHWAEQLRHYRPDLVIINYGTNESGFPNFVDTTWGHEMREVVRRVHEALPGVAVLLMSPMDRGEKKATGEIDTLPSIPRLVNIEEKIALDNGAAFFNTFAAMGGQGTMARWYMSEPRLVGADYIHPMPAGAKIVGELLFSALREGFNQYKMHELKQKIAQLDAQAARMRQRP